MVLAMFAFTWTGVLLGMLVRSPDAMQGVGFIVIFPLAFLAGTFVPIAGMDAVPRAIAQWDPISALVASVRGLTEGVGSTGSWQLAHPEIAMALWCLVIIGVVRAAGAASVQPRCWRAEGAALAVRPLPGRLVLGPPRLERRKRGVDDPVDEHLAVVEPRERSVGHAHAQELAQRAPTVDHVPHEQPLPGMSRCTWSW